MKYNFPLRIFVVGWIVLLTSSCSEPGTKEAYMKGFEKFIERVKTNYRNYNQNDWKWADLRFEKFNSEWFNHFKEELSAGEKLKVAAWVVEYEAMKGSDSIRDFYRKNISSEVDKTGQEVKEYLRDDLGKDLSQAAKGAKEIGDSAIKVLDDIARELRKKR